MTEELAPAEPYTTTFEATVERVDGRSVVLDRTCFYAESGGQPADRGTLGGVEVTHVAHDDGAVVHELAEAPAFGVGETVAGAVDPAFRTYCMRAHTASHVLYGAGRRLFEDLGYGGFDISEEKVRVDLSTPTDIDDDALVELERLTNRTVWDSRPVSWAVLPREAALDIDGIAFNTKTEEGVLADSDTIRVVTVGENGIGDTGIGDTGPGRDDPRDRGADGDGDREADGDERGGGRDIGNPWDGDPWDVAACGGTHVVNTREVGPVSVIERSNPGEGLTRVEFAVGPPGIGHRVREKEAVLEAAGTVGTNVADLPAEAARLQDEVARLEGELADLQGRLVDARLAELRESVVERDGRTWLVGTVDGVGPNDLRERVQSLAGEAADAVVLAGVDGSTFLVAGTAGDLDADEVVEEITAEFGGGGGGSPDFAQGGGLDADPEDVVEYLREK